ncbi:hypothetical protein [Gordonia aichiensis]|uniref:Uncharacterized protein n=1 Tax=Gordonia aichiensis NBRC 108223 TaxID=1220583 RepID=L7KL49_9ACTN|nr:hypothetical protein GOACH_06_01740 [Gordonia aichiensis NBRC 108223]
MSAAEAPMSENQNDEQTSIDGRGRRAPGLALVGVAALAVAIWGLVGTPELPSASVLGWGVVGIGLVVGLVLLVSGARRR